MSSTWFIHLSRLSIFAALQVLASHVPTIFAQEASFQGLGDLPGGGFESHALDVSSDGSVVVGVGYGTSGGEAFRWTASDGMIGLGDLPGGNFSSTAYATSGNGAVVVGRSSSSFGEHEAFRWTQSEGITGLGDFPDGDFLSIAYSVSSDGSTVVGWGTSTREFEAFRWTPNEGIVGLDELPIPEFISQATGVSSDGSVIVGGFGSNESVIGARWTADNGFQPLTTKGGIENHPFDVSADGTVVIGSAFFVPELRQAFRWTDVEGFTELGRLHANRESFAVSVSANGAVIVGWEGALQDTEAFLWNGSSGCGLKSLRKVLVHDLELDLTRWKLTDARGVSGDGLTIVGTGINPDNKSEAWIARLPHLPIGSAGTCDVNRDGFEDGRDIPPMIAAVLDDDDDQQTLCAADMDGSGAVDAGDLPLFVECLLADD